MPIRRSAAVTTGLWVSEWGQIGVITSVAVPASTIGPPAARLYAVDPIGVATINPSALYSAILNSPTVVISDNILGAAPCLT